MMLQSPVAQTAARRIVQRTKGYRHGPITRLVSPSGVGAVLKPFVFLDLFESTSSTPFSGFGLHPHSGIATATYLFEGGVRYEDTSGASGVLPAGGMEWFKAGHGAWHGGGPTKEGNARGFQLWLALPPEQELGSVESIYLSPGEVPQAGPARLLLGAYAAATSSIRAPGAPNYLAVRLKAGEVWRYAPPRGHTVGWAALSAGSLLLPDEAQAGELVIFNPSDAAIDFRAQSDAEFVVGSAAPHRHDLALGHYSVHTNPESLEAGERRIVELRRRLEREGRL
jgi:redox-sensitive bicupin YhaK (pirin superfamily)